MHAASGLFFFILMRKEKDRDKRGKKQQYVMQSLISAAVCTDTTADCADTTADCTDNTGDCTDSTAV